MDREIQHILSENYPNPPPPGFRYPPLPRIIQLNEDEINMEYSSDEHLASETVTNLEDEEDEFHDTLSISIYESIEESPAADEYVQITESNSVLENIVEEKVEHDYQIAVEETVEHNVEKVLSNKILEDIIEERLEHDYQKAVEETVQHNVEKAESIKILENIIEERVEQDLQKGKNNDSIEAETKNVKELLNINKVENSLQIVNENTLKQVDQLSKLQFLKYPHSPPFGLYHMFIPKIAACYSNEDEHIENHHGAQQNDEKQKITSQLELINFEETDVSEEHLKKLPIENENHSIIEKNIINSQPKTTDKDQQVNKTYKTTDEVVGNDERIEQRIKTTICCCIKI